MNHEIQCFRVGAQVEQHKPLIETLSHVLKHRLATRVNFDAFTGAVDTLIETARLPGESKPYGGVETRDLARTHHESLWFRGVGFYIGKTVGLLRGNPSSSICRDGAKFSGWSPNSPRDAHAATLCKLIW